MRDGPTAPAGAGRAGSWIDRISFSRGEQYLVLADALHEAIRSGQLVRGARLPTQRDLARRLNLSIGTVSRAYTEAARRGLVAGRVGSGTVVTADGAPPAAAEPAADARGGERRALDALYVPLAPRADIVNLSLNYPLTDRLGPLLAGALAELAAAGDIAEIGRYQPPNGHPAHRRAGAAWLDHVGVRASPDDLAVVPGGQGGLTAIVQALCRPGDSVLTEHLTWPGMMALAAALGVHLRPVPMDDAGLDPDALEAACRAHRPKLLYTAPTLHNPTGLTTPEPRRRDIARIAQAHDVTIVEDDAYGFLAPDQPPPYLALARDITVYLTSLSKPVAPALRVGYAAAPARLLRPLISTIRATTVMVSPILAELAARMIESGAAQDAARYQRESAAARQRVAAALLDDDPADRPLASFHRWLRLPAAWRTADFVAEALAQGVAVTPGDAFSVVPGVDPSAVRVCLSAAPDEAALVRGLTALRTLLRADTAARMPFV